MQEMRIEIDPNSFMKLANSHQMVLPHICMGKTDKEIAIIRGLSRETVKEYAHQLFERVGVKNRTQLAVVAVYYRWVRCIAGQFVLNDAQDIAKYNGPRITI